MSDVVDRYFEGESWEAQPAPSQDFPGEISQLLNALNDTRRPGWLLGDRTLRDYGEAGRTNVAEQLSSCRASLAEHNSRYFQFVGSPSLFVWLQRSGIPPKMDLVKAKASAAAVAAKSGDVVGLLITATPSGYEAAETFTVEIPSADRADAAAILADAARMKVRQHSATGSAAWTPTAIKPPGRNEPCWCGSGLKFKKCHGR